MKKALIITTILGILTMTLNYSTGKTVTEGEGDCFMFGRPSNEEIFREMVKSSNAIFIGSVIKTAPHKVEGRFSRSVCWISFSVEDILKGKIEPNPKLRVYYTTTYTQTILTPLTSRFFDPRSCPLKVGDRYLVYAGKQGVTGTNYNASYRCAEGPYPLPKYQDKVMQTKAFINQSVAGE